MRTRPWRLHASWRARCGSRPAPASRRPGGSAWSFARGCKDSLGRLPGFAAGVLQHPQELIAIPAELGHLVGDLAGHLVDRNEEGHLALAERVQDLSLPADHPED